MTDAAAWLARLRERAEAILDEIAAGRAVADVPGVLAPLFRPSVQPYLMSWLAYDPAREIAALAAPVLVVHGTTDAQLPADDARRLAAAKPGAPLVVVPGVNHVMKRALSAAEQRAAYTDPSVPLDPRVIDAIASFVAAQTS